MSEVLHREQLVAALDQDPVDVRHAHARDGGAGTGRGVDQVEHAVAGVGDDEHRAALDRLDAVVVEGAAQVGGGAAQRQGPEAAGRHPVDHRDEVEQRLGGVGEPGTVLGQCDVVDEGRGRGIWNWYDVTGAPVRVS